MLRMEIHRLFAFMKVIVPGKKKKPFKLEALNNDLEFDILMLGPS
jgi:hypothetical protein